MKASPDWNSFLITVAYFSAAFCVFAGAVGLIAIGDSQHGLLMLAVMLGFLMLAYAKTRERMK